MLIDLKSARYLSMCAQAAQDPDSEVPWLETCPECGERPNEHDMKHLVIRTAPNADRPGILAVVVACEEYYVVNPAILGLRADHPNWTDVNGNEPCVCGAGDGVHLPSCPARES